MAREDGYIANGPDWIAFNSDDAYIEASAKRGSRAGLLLSVDAYLLSTDDAAPTEGDVREWVDRQPIPALGLLFAGTRDLGDGTVQYCPVISVDLRVDGVVGEFLTELIFPFAEAWDRRSVAEGTDELEFGPEGRPYRVSDPLEIEPRNAWLLVGTEASYPTPEALVDSWAEASAGIYDVMWTAPKNGEVGDLVLIYFLSPRKSAHFVARLASEPFWRTDIEVTADNAVDQHQWWAYITPMVEIEPIPYKALQAAHNGYLPLRGRSGHYLLPESISQLTFEPVRHAQQPDLERIVHPPTGRAELPDPETVTLAAWREMPSGPLALEAHVSMYIVRPLKHLVYGPGWEWTQGEREPRIEPTIGPILVPEHRTSSGYADFLFMYPASIPALAVEVKLTILRPSSGVWLDSPDFQQLRRYMDSFSTAGLLVDAQHLLLVRRGADEPFAEIVRAEATWNDIAMIRDLLLEAGAERGGLTPAVAVRPRRVLRRD
ncbi:hypothetical protein DEA06_06800 [Microbacterium sp. Gd 4-13]|nr:hypothetical protein DEA06_06800 [Microbacterium sp. Gd 4-13]